MAAVFQRGVFQGGGVFQVGADTSSVGSSISGGTFSRGQWRKLREDEERARLAAQRKLERIERDAREAARKRAAEQRAAVEARRRVEDEAAVERLRALLLSASPNVSPIMQAAQDGSALQVAIAQAMQEQDEEEAIALLLLQ